MSNESISNCKQTDWARPALASCHILKWIGGYLCFIFVCGVMLNGILLSILRERKHRRSPIDVFMMALCFSDLLAALLGIPLPLTSNLACRWLYGRYLCYYEGFVAYFVGMVGLYLLTSLSLNRYWMIVTPNNEQLVSFQTAYISVLLSIMGGLFWAVPPIFGWNDYTLEGVRTSCSICWQDRSANVTSYNVMMFIFAYLVPLMVMLYCYTCIYLKVRHAAQRKVIWNRSLTSVKLRAKRRDTGQHMVRSIFLIILTFVIAWTPYAIVAFISSFFSPTLISPLGGTIPAIFAKSSIYFNPLVYIITNSHIRSKVFYWRTLTKRTEDGDSGPEKYEVTVGLCKTRPLLMTI